MLRNKFSRHLPGANILEETGVSFTIILLVVGMILLSIFLLLLASTTIVNEAIKAQGQILPLQGVIQIQPSEGGSIKRIHVQDGQLVKKGALLVSLNNSTTNADQKQVQARLMSLIAKAIRQQAFLKNEYADFSGISANYQDVIDEQRTLLKNQKQALQQSLLVFDQQINQKLSEIELNLQNLKNMRSQEQVNESLFTLKQELGTKKLVSRMSQLDAKRVHLATRGKRLALTSQLKQAQISLQEVKERKNRFKEQIQQQAAEELGQINDEISQTRTMLERLNNRRQNLFVRAPISGWVQNSKVQTIGGVFKSGDMMMEIVPSDADLQLELRIEPKDMGFVKPGQKVAIQVTSYAAEKFGKLTGEIVSVSPFTQMHTDRTFFYKGIVKLNSSFVGNPEDGRMVLPGMTVEADIISGNRSILNYIIKPLLKTSRDVAIVDSLETIHRELKGIF